MSPYLAYFLGVITVILIIVIAYIFALLFPSFQTNFYDPIFCNFQSGQNVTG